MQQVVKMWVERAEYDLESASVMLHGGRYLYVAFMCQQATEKLLKGIIQHSTTEIPPYTHNLVALAQHATLKLTEEQLDFLALLTRYYLNSRYPDAKQQLAETLGQEKAKVLFKQTEDFFIWLKKEFKI